MMAEMANTLGAVHGAYPSPRDQVFQHLGHRAAGLLNPANMTSKNLAAVIGQKRVLVTGDFEAVQRTSPNVTRTVREDVVFRPDLFVMLAARKEADCEQRWQVDCQARMSFEVRSFCLFRALCGSRHQLNPA